jgi:hypothetical protein
VGEASVATAAYIEIGFDHAAEVDIAKQVFPERRIGTTTDGPGEVRGSQPDHDGVQGDQVVGQRSLVGLPAHPEAGNLDAFADAQWAGTLNEGPDGAHGRISLLILPGDGVQEKVGREPQGKRVLPPCNYKRRGLAFELVGHDSG